jgi:hypothetical protein
MPAQMVKKFPALLWIPKVLCRIHKKPNAGPYVRQMDLVLTLISSHSISVLSSNVPRDSSL